MKKLHLIILLSISTIVSSCFTDLDDEIRPATSSEISEFIYRGLNFWSIYKENVPDLANDRFASNAERNEFLKTFDTPEEAFEGLTWDNDRFSILRDDYIILENALAGIRTTNGMRFSIRQDPNDSSNLFGVVVYVVNNSPASNAGISRGMIFKAVNGENLTSSSDQNALFGQDSYTINLADYDGTNFTLNGTDITLTKEQLSINPVHRATTSTVNGKKVGYLHYTGFTNEFDPQLNAAFANFKAEGVTELILDVRYNGGGSIETANDLCSMITGQFTGQTFIKQQYNEDRNPDNEFTRKFNTQIGNGAAINSLNLSTVYVLTTRNTASASELILSGLDPYINIVQIGGTTRGKFEGSFLLYDAPAPNFRRSEANPNHRYVMLPLVLKSVNANGLTDYFNGFTPDLEITENPFNLGVQGEESDPYTAAAFDMIAGRSPRNAYHTEVFYSTYESDQQSPMYQRMFVEEID